MMIIIIIIIIMINELKKILIETYVGNSCVFMILFLFVQEDGLVYYNNDKC